MTEGHKHSNYLAIWACLLGLTILELVTAVALAKFKATMIILLCGMALAKAILVAMFFMHLRFERKTFVIVVCAPVILAVILVLALLPDVGFAG